MYMLIGLYLLAPILSAWLVKASKKEIAFYLCLWSITMCYPIIRSFISVNESTTGILYYFGGYAGYFLIGYYLKKYAYRITLWKILLLFAIPLGFASVVKLKNISVDFYDLFWYLSIFTAMMSIGCFLIIRQYVPLYNATSKTHRLIVTISNCCFGIYLSHIFIMRGLLWHWEFLRSLSGVTQILTTTLLTFTGSLLLTWLISYLPGSSYIIGFTNRKKK